MAATSKLNTADRRTPAKSGTSREQILHALRRRPGQSQISLVRELNLGQATVSVAVGDLLSRGMIVATGHDRSTGGRRAERLALNPDRPLMLGIDLGEAEAQLGLVTLEGRLVSVERVKFRRTKRGVATEPVMAAARQLTTKRTDIAGIGVAVPGVVDSAAGQVRNAANLGWKELPLAAMFEDGVGIPTIVERNAHAALLGEEWWGSVDGDPFIFITLGSGVGAGLRLNHAFVHGATANAGEFGHLTVDPGGDRCRCGRRGCLETKASAGALVDLHYRLATTATRRATRRRSVARIAAAARDGDTTAQRAIHEVADYLAAGLITLITLLNPRVLMLGGELLDAHDLLLPRVREVVSRDGPHAANAVEIVPSTFGDQAVVIGAAALAFDRMFRIS